MENVFLTSIIQLLKDNKSFPNYQAERRIDIFINLFLEDILAGYLGESVEFICPEFPLKKEEDNRSTKLDYLYKTDRHIIFVELKTDSKSFNLKQMKYYFHNGSWKPWEEYLKNIVKISKDLNYIILCDKLTKSGLYDSNSKDLPIKVIYISPELKDSDRKKIQKENYELIKFKLIASNPDWIKKFSSEWNTLSEFFGSFKLGIFEIIKMK